MSRLVAGLIMAMPALVVAFPALAQSGSDAPAGIAVARLSGLQEVPTLSTAGRGRFFAEIAGDAIDYRLEYSGLESEVAQAHIHFARRAINGGISVFLCTNLDNGPTGTQPCPTGDGEITGTIVPGDVIGPEDQGIAPGQFEELLDAIERRAAYVNVHTTVYPAGEIRGQIATVLDDDRHGTDKRSRSMR